MKDVEEGLEPSTTAKSALYVVANPIAVQIYSVFLKQPEQINLITFV